MNRRQRPSAWGASRSSRQAAPAWWIAFLLLTLRVWAQTDSGSVAGTVLESWDATPLAGVTVTVRGTTLATTTDAAGQFRLDEVPPGDQTLRFSRSGYATAVVTDVRVLAGQVTRADGLLRPEFYEMEEYVVTAEEFREEAVQLLQERQETSALIEAIGAERFSQLAAGDAAEIMTKITGVSVVEGKFAVVRGLSDRYNLTVLNGGEVPTADPYRKSAQLDMFPSEVLETVVVSKTFTPDLPGGFSGALVDLRTKSFPEKFMVASSVGLGFNTQSTGNKDYLTYPGGSTDAFGIDDGTRALPDELKQVTSADLQALKRVYSNAHRTNNTPEAIERKREAAELMDAYARAFGTPYLGPTTEAPPPDHDFSLLLGDTVKLANRPFGYYTGLGFERDFRFDDDGVRARYTPSSSDNPTVQTTNSYFRDARSLTTAQWSALVNLAYQLADDHEIAFNFLYSQVGEDEARHLEGRILTSGEDQFANTNRVTHINSLYFTERNLTSYQLKGHHAFPSLRDLRVDWLGGLANTYQDEPDLRYFNLIADTSGPEPEPQLEVNQNYIPEPQSPTRYFRHLEDDSVNGKLDFTLPFADPRQLEWKLKSGLATTRSQRSYEERTFSYEGGNGTFYDPSDFPYDYLTIAPPPEAVTNAAGRVYYEVPRALSSQFGNSFYDGQQDIDALYALTEVPLLASLRLAGGVRYETTYLEILSQQPRAEPETSLIDQGDLLPAVNLTWAFRPQMNLRASYAETVARPTYREFADNRSYDQFTGIIVAGNPLLTMSSIRNYDLRWEWFMTQGGVLSVGGFYKEVEAPIERVNGEVDPNGELNLGGNVLTFVNGPEAMVWGLEFEARQSLKVIDPLLEPFSFGVNFAWINSEVDNLDPLIERKQENNIPSDVRSRPLYDQSPYIINTDVTYENKRSGTAVTVIFYYAAERLSLITEAFDVYEQGAPSLDLVISQKLGKGFKLKFSAENLLNPDVIESYAVDGHSDTTYLFSSYSKGITFGLSLSYSY